MTEEKIYTVEEVANYFKVSKKTISRMIRARLIIAVRFNRQIRIAQSEIERLKKQKEIADIELQRSPALDDQIEE